VLLLAALGCGSWSTRWRPGDAAATAAAPPPGRDPELFVDRLPRRRYTVIGIIEVHAPSSQPMAAFVERAVAEGRARGCEVLVARHLHVGSLPRPPVLVAQRAPTRTGGTLGHNPDGEVFGDDAPLRKRRDFVCGIYEPA
jgi:hypothetical protein